MKDCLMLFVVGLLLTIVHSTAQSAECKPNILIIMTDHWLSDAMSCVIGDEYINTPAIDSLAANSTDSTWKSSAKNTPIHSRRQQGCKQPPEIKDFLRRSQNSDISKQKY